MATKVKLNWKPIKSLASIDPKLVKDYSVAAESMKAAKGKLFAAISEKLAMREDVKEDMDDEDEVVVTSSRFDPSKFVYAIAPRAKNGGGKGIDL